MGIRSNIEKRADLLKHGCLHNLVKSCKQHRSFWGESLRNEMGHKQWRREWGWQGPKSLQGNAPPL
jgi:hypothetical protein